MLQVVLMLLDARRIIMAVVVLMDMVTLMTVESARLHNSDWEEPPSNYEGG